MSDDRTGERGHGHEGQRRRTSGVRRPGPSIGTLLWRGATVRCPACGRRGLFRRIFSMRETCPDCGLRFERIEGHWIGSIGINTILSFGTLGVFVIGATILTYPDGSIPLLIGLGVLVGLIAPTVFFPVSRTLWTAIDIAMRPLEPHEVDWTVVGGLQSSASPDR